MPNTRDEDDKIADLIAEMRKAPRPQSANPTRPAMTRKQAEHARQRAAAAQALAESIRSGGYGSAIAFPVTDEQALALDARTQQHEANRAAKAAEADKPDEAEGAADAEAE